jgi:large conductance mechanosensitive channel
MSLLKEFKTFAMRGNVIDMAVGIIIGGAFGKIVTSLVNDIIMPPIGLLLGNMDFSQLSIVLRQESINELGSKVPAVTIGYGVFINTVINFIIVAFAIFMMIKAINAAKKKQEAAPAAPPQPSAEVKILTEIRDLLSKK